MCRAVKKNAKAKKNVRPGSAAKLKKYIIKNYQAGKAVKRASHNTKP